jgi:hypothetical protein
VALTADALVGDAEKSRVAGMDGHLTKSLARKRLAAALERWVRAGAEREQCPRAPAGGRCVGARNDGPTLNVLD